ncbi:HAD family hydrolase [Peptostreptococcus faecalis]|uniref:HAD family hydrolase n=1 Tax=Peptostreptococcus faecalis TaxID=2045015 RepID=UPI0015E08E4D|nr:Cof-type HAD-IIB family hydrolase [Peptostreptococcus faecalis]
MIKAIFFDVDGTLLTLGKHIMPESTLNSLKKLREKGIKLFVASARHFSMLKHVTDYFEFDGYILLNGQYCIDREGAVIYDKPIDEKTAYNLKKFLDTKKIQASFITKTGNYVNELSERLIETVEEMGIDIPPEIDPLSDDEAIYQLMMYIDDDSWLDLKKNITGLSFTNRYDKYIEILPEDAGKAKGILKTLKFHNINTKHTMAFGDSDNDIDMLNLAGYGISMGNGSDNLKKISDYVTDSIDEDGIYKALKKLEVI